MIWGGCIKKLLEVICGLPHLAYKIMLGSGDEFLIRVVGILIVITFIVAGGDRDLLGPLLRPPLVASGTPLCTLVGCFGRCPPTAAWSHLLAVLHKNGPDRFLARGVPGGDVEEFFHGLWLVTADLVH
jgi:hypothetical protein